ncbi:hypothetical protein CLU97_3754 [Chryseobacterium sp. 7]|nr:hypothetical protein CLU97_3754 [Chryseobacterium sp. 7]
MILLTSNNYFCGNYFFPLKKANNWDYVFMVSIAILYVVGVYFSLYILKIITDRVKQYFSKSKNLKRYQSN